MRVATWNVNSIRARTERLAAWIERWRPDVLAVQETKCTDEVFAAIMADVLPDGYEFVHHGADHWNGVGIISRVGIDDVRRGLPGPNRAPFDEPRVVSAVCAGIDVHSVYAPNGRGLDDPHYLFKLVWLERLRNVHRVGRPTMIVGDLNVAPADADIYDPKRWRRRTHASPPERAAIVALTDTGLVDVTRRHLPGDPAYTWWSYRPGQFELDRGLRIDLALCSVDLADRLHRVAVDRHERVDDHPNEKPSDHAPLVVDLDRPGGAVPAPRTATVRATTRREEIP